MLFSLKQQTAALMVVLCIVPMNAFAGPVTKADTKPVLRNVELADGGTIHGRVLDVHGRPISSTMVIVETKDGLQEVATNDKGQFVLAGLKGGPCVVKVGDALYGARLWTQGTAPPKSLKDFSVVNDPNFVARGQDWDDDSLCCLTPAQCLGLALLAGGVVAIILAADDDDDPPGS